MSKREFTFSIKYKLMLIMFFLLALAIGIVAFVSVILIEKDKTTYIYDLNSSIARTYASQIQVSLDNKVKNIDEFIASYTVAKDRKPLLKRFMKTNPDLINLAIFSKKKTKANIQTEDEETLKIKKQIFNSIHFAKEVKKKLRTKKEKNKINYSLALNGTKLINNSTFSKDLAIYTLTFPSKYFKNLVISADFRADLFKNLFAQADVYDAYLVSSDGKLIAHPVTEELVNTKDFSSLEIVKYITTPGNTAGVTEYQSSNRIMLGAYALVNKWNSGIIIEVPKAFAFLGAKNLIRALIQIVIVIFALSLILIIFFSRSMSNPIIKLSALTKEIAKGNFKTTIKPQSSDEIGLLAKDFNIMIQKLDDLTKQVVQSTKMASIGSLARSIGHEFGNILGAIIGHADLVMMEKTLEGARKRANIIIDGAERASLIVKNLKGISKSDEKVMKDEKIVNCVQSVVLLAEPDYKKRGLIIETNFKEDFTVLIDARQVSQVFLNMLINAGHAMERGGKMTVTIEKGKEHYVSIIFTDTGCGIPPENLQKIFEPLFTTKGDIGTGLGLSVSKDIVETHGGRISVSSKVGTGTTFLIELPIKT